MARKPPQAPAKAAARRRVAGPVDQSRGSGPRVPDSVASVSPPPMYDPGGFDETEVEEVVSALGGIEVDDDFNAGLRAESDRFEDADLSADHEVTEAAVNADTTGAQTRDEIARIRAMRKPLGTTSQKLALPTRRGYHRHWFNDAAGRIEEAQEAGWAFVKGNDGRNIKRCVGTGRDKNALWAYAMELPLVFWQEDQDSKNAAASAVMSGLKNQAFAAAPGSMKKADSGKFYDPTETGAPIKTGVHR